jgi:hypothetical protein
VEFSGLYKCIVIIFVWNVLFFCFLPYFFLCFTLADWLIDVEFDKQFRQFTHRFCRMVLKWKLQTWKCMTLSFWRNDKFVEMRLQSVEIY